MRIPRGSNLRGSDIYLPSLTPSTFIAGCGLDIRQRYFFLSVSVTQTREDRENKAESHDEFHPISSAHLAVNHVSWFRAILVRIWYMTVRKQVRRLLHSAREMGKLFTCSIAIHCALCSVRQMRFSIHAPFGLKYVKYKNEYGTITVSRTRYAVSYGPFVSAV